MHAWLIPLWVLVEALAGLIVFVLCLATPFMNALLGWVARGERPLLLVHGFGMISGCMLVVGWRFARTGHRPVVVGFSSLRDLEHAAEKLAGRAAALALHTGVARIDIVAHSVGGLVARTARDLPGGAAIGRIVTLGTPHRGEWWHTLPIGPLRLAMRAGRFGTGEADDLAITSRADLIIRWSRATLDPPSRTLILDAAGHAGLLLDPRAHRAAIAHLAPPALLAAPR